jgi:hypothetical protein
MSVKVTGIRRTRRRVAVVVRVSPEQRGQDGRAEIRGRVRDGALVSANGIKWRFDR